MIVVSDTSPITSLITIQRINLLRELFDTVLIPPAVERELLAFHNRLPEFIRVEASLDIETLRLSNHCSTKEKQRPLRWRRNSSPNGC
jgi:uncharacterized protein